jgi:hypothetical protein
MYDHIPGTSPKIQTWFNYVFRQAQDERFGPFVVSLSNHKAPEQLNFGIASAFMTHYDSKLQYRDPYNSKCMTSFWLKVRSGACSNFDNVGWPYYSPAI